MSKYRLFLILPLLAVFGCGVNEASKPAPTGYYLNPTKNLKALGRTALVELAHHSSAYRVESDVTEALFEEIQKRQIFGLTRIRQDDPAWRSMPIEADGSYTPEEMAWMRKTFKCNAVLTGTITQFEPYPHLTLGLRLRLVDLSDGQLLWAVEQVWDSTDKSTLDRIEAYYNPKHLFFDSSNLGGQLGSISSLKFFKFVAHEVAMMLPSEF
ncbi:MAG: hypothetical protein KBI46_00365 [Phycisphaerae bacterium]|nr:hypothetical protein [Phycisphaerae bacterium]